MYAVDCWACTVIISEDPTPSYKGIWKVKTVLFSNSPFDIYEHQECVVSGTSDVALELYNLKSKLLNASKSETLSTPNVTIATNFCPVPAVSGAAASTTTVLISTFANEDVGAYCASVSFE